MTRKTPKPQKRRSSGRGALLILAAVFAMSSAARLLSGTGAAIAREISQLSTEEAMVPDGDAGLCLPDTETAILFESLQKREARIAEEESVVAKKMKALELARAEFEKNIVALQNAEARLAATMSVASTAAQDDLAKLTDVYENMKPKDAAALFEKMAPEFAAGFLSRMRSEAAAAVLAGLDPEAAYTISVILAGRNANVPRE